MSRKLTSALSGLSISGLILAGSLPLMAQKPAEKSCGGDKGHQKAEKAKSKEKTNKQNKTKEVQSTQKAG